MVELKTVNALDDAHRMRRANYLQATRLRFCLLLNVGKPRPAVKRAVHERRCSPGVLIPLVTDQTISRRSGRCALFGCGRSAARSVQRASALIYVNIFPVLRLASRSLPSARRAIAAGAWSGIANTELTLISHRT
jgi:PD-(D/E)XK nuclease superfamily